MKRVLIALGVLGLVCAAGTAKAQEDLKRLDVWVGDWTWEDAGKDSKSGEEWKQEGTGQVRRLGEFFYVMSNEWKNADGDKMSMLSITGYDPVEKAYFARGFGSDGWRGTATVTFGDKTVTHDWTGVTAAGEKTRMRCTDVLADSGPNSCETLTDGKWWVSSKGKSKKVK